MEAAPGPARKRKDRDDAAAGPSSAAAGAGDEGGSNRLLAGYLAHEFLTCGTVLGERLEPGPEAGQGQGQPARYRAVAALVQGGVARVPGVVNPAQLAAWARN